MKASILEKLDRLTERYQEVSGLLSEPDIIAEQSRFRDLSREYAELEPVVQQYDRYRKVQASMAEAESLLHEGDSDMREMAREELHDCERQLEPLGVELQRLLLPRDPDDEKNVFLEIRAGTGG